MYATIVVLFWKGRQELLSLWLDTSTFQNLYALSFLLNFPPLTGTHRWSVKADNTTSGQKPSEWQFLHSYFSEKIICLKQFHIFSMKIFWSYKGIFYNIFLSTFSTVSQIYILLAWQILRLLASVHNLLFLQIPQLHIFQAFLVGRCGTHDGVLANEMWVEVMCTSWSRPGPILLFPHGPA